MAKSLASPCARERSGMFCRGPILLRCLGVSASYGYLSRQFERTDHFGVPPTVRGPYLRSISEHFMDNGLVVPALGRIIAGLALCAILTCAQTTDGNLVGTVTDSSGAAVPKSQVTATNKDTGVQYSAVTDDVGEYRFNHLPVGAYDITAAAQNFALQTAANVFLFNDTATTE